MRQESSAERINRVTRWGVDDKPPSALPGDQVNYLSNSNNIHGVFGSVPDEREPNHMVRPPRENSRSRSRSKGYGDPDRRPELYAGLEPVNIRLIPQMPAETA